MEITVNNAIKTIGHSSLALLMEELLGDKTRGVAVAVNQTIVPKTSWPATALKANDSILIIKATQGG